MQKKWLFLLLTLTSTIAAYLSTLVEKIGDISESIRKLMSSPQNISILLALLLFVLIAMYALKHSNKEKSPESFFKKFLSIVGYTVTLITGFEKIRSFISSIVTFIAGHNNLPPPPMPLPISEEHAMEYPFIKIIKGQRAGSKMAVPSTRLIIGRDANYCQLVLSSPSHDVSRRHCTVYFNEKEKVVMLEDYGSRNGTYVNGRDRLVNGEAYRLRHGDRFRLGSEGEEFEVVFE